MTPRMMTNPTAASRSHAHSILCAVDVPPCHQFTYYVAGPMRGHDLYNFPAFDSAAAWLRSEGYAVIPAVDDTLPDGFVEGAMRRDVQALLAVDGVALLPGWEDSAGVKVELAVARGLGLPVWELVAPSDYVCATETTWSHLEPLTADDQEARQYGLVIVGDVPPWAATDAVWVRRTDSSSTTDPELQRLLDEEAEIEARVNAQRRLDAAPGASGRPCDECWRTPTRHCCFDWPESAAEEPLDPTTTFPVSETGGVKGVKPAQVHQIPPGFLLGLGEVYARGVAKYADIEPGRPNWSQGYPWSASYSALHRHLAAFWSGEHLDPEDGLPHLLHAAWHCATLFTWHSEGIAPQHDDRPKYLTTTA